MSGSAATSAASSRMFPGSAEIVAGEQAFDAAQPADGSVRQEPAREAPLRMVDDPVARGRHEAGPVAHLDQRRDVGGPHGQQLLHQRVLIRFECAHPPSNVQDMRQRDVDGVDLRIGGQRVVAVVDTEPGDRRRERRRLAGRAAGDCGEAMEAGGVQGRGDLAQRKGSGPEDAPSDRSGHRSPSRERLRPDFGCPVT